MAGICRRKRRVRKTGGLQIQGTVLESLRVVGGTRFIKHRGTGKKRLSKWGAVDQLYKGERKGGARKKIVFLQTAPHLRGHHNVSSQSKEKKRVVTEQTEQLRKGAEVVLTLKISLIGRTGGKPPG